MSLFRSLVIIVVFLSFSSMSFIGSELHWMTFEEAIELNKKQPKKILIDIYTDWCGWCKRMDKDTYAKEGIINAINKNFYAVKLNAEQKESIQFNDHTFKFVPSGRRGVHELAAALTQNKLSYPTTVFMNEKIEIIQPLAGYMKADKLLPILKYIGEDHFKTVTWEEYQADYRKDS